MPAVTGRYSSYSRRPNPLAANTLLDWDFSSPNALWLDASSNVLGIADKSGNAKFGTKTNAGAITWSATAVNGQPGISVANANCQIRSAANVALPGTFTVLLLAKITAGATSTIYEHGQTGSGTNIGSILRGGVASTAQVRRTVSSSKNLVSGWPDGSPHVLAHVMDGTHAGHVLYIDNVIQALTNHTQTSDPGAATCTDVFSLGGGNTSTTACAAIYGRAIVCNKALSASELTAMTAFLRAQWKF